MNEKLLDELEQLEEEQDFEKVIEMIDSIISNDPNLTSPLLFRKVTALMGLKKYEIIIKLLKPKLPLFNDEELYEAYAVIGFCHCKIGENDKGEEYMLKAFELHPDEFSTKNLVYHYHINDQHRKCIDFILKLDEKNAADIEDYTIMIDCLIELDELEAAIKYGERIMELDANNADIYRSLVTSYQKAKKEDKLKEIYEKIINLEDDTDDWQLLLLKSQAYLELGYPKKAFEIVEKVIKLNPYDPTPYLMKGLLLSLANEENAAQECFNEAYRLSPELLTKTYEMID